MVRALPPTSFAGLGWGALASVSPENPARRPPENARPNSPKVVSATSGASTSPTRPACTLCPDPPPLSAGLPPEASAPSAASACGLPAPEKPSSAPPSLLEGTTIRSPDLPTDTSLGIAEGGCIAGAAGLEASCIRSCRTFMYDTALRLETPGDPAIPAPPSRPPPSPAAPCSGISGEAPDASSRARAFRSAHAGDVLDRPLAPSDSGLPLPPEPFPALPL